jgi:hypothetical protein
MDRDTNDLTIVIACDCETDAAEFNQVFSGSREGAMPSELSLMAAVLSFAIYEKDLEWINGDDYSEHPFSFRNCCEYLGIDHLAARKVLNQRLGKCRGVPFPATETGACPQNLRRSRAGIFPCLQRVPSRSEPLQVPRMPAEVQRRVCRGMASDVAIADARCGATGRIERSLLQFDRPGSAYLTGSVERWENPARCKVDAEGVSFFSLRPYRADEGQTWRFITRRFPKFVYQISKNC